MRYVLFTLVKHIVANSSNNVNMTKQETGKEILFNQANNKQIDWSSKIDCLKESIGNKLILVNLLIATKLQLY